MKRIVVLLIILLVSPLFANTTTKKSDNIESTDTEKSKNIDTDTKKSNNMDGIPLNNYYDQEKITYNEGVIVGFQDTNIYSSGIFLEFHTKKHSFGFDAITDGDITAGLELFFKYNFYNKISYMQAGFYLNGSSIFYFEDTDKLDFSVGAGMFYSLELGEDRKWFFEISAGTIVLIQKKKPNPDLRFDLKFGRLF